MSNPHYRSPPQCTSFTKNDAASGSHAIFNRSKNAASSLNSASSPWDPSFFAKKAAATVATARTTSSTQASTSARTRTTTTSSLSRRSSIINSHDGRPPSSDVNASSISSLSSFGKTPKFMSTYCPVIKTSNDTSLSSSNHRNNNDTTFNNKANGTNNNTTSASTKIKPYRFRDEPQKKNIVKTELCSAILDGRPCKFGSKCNFAHNESELRYQTIVERHEAGLIDGEIWRTRPCFNHVATGDCPFWIRCACIHDPRLSSREFKWWLPHCALKSKHLETDIHVDRNGKYHFSQTHFGQPFGKSLADDSAHTSSIMSKIKKKEKNDNVLKNSTSVGNTNSISGINSSVPSSGDVTDISSNEWEKFYSRITNKDRTVTPRTRNYSTCHNTTHNCTEYHRLQVALAMRHPYESTSVYNYQPSHKFLNEICMLIQTKTFVIQKNNEVMELPKCEYDSANPNHIIVREIAFGPLCSPSDRPLALWFGIPDEDVEECTPKEISNLKRTGKKLAQKKKQLLDAKANSATHPACSSSQLPPRIPRSTTTRSTSGNAMTYAQIMSKKNNVKSTPSATISVTRSSFDDTSPDFEKEFLLYCPKDEAAYQFVTEILQHRVNALDPTKDTQDIALKYNVLERKHASLMRHFGLFHWPVNKGRAVVTKYTPIPKIDTRYEVPVMSEDGKEEDRVMETGKNEFFHNLWTSFLDAAEFDFSSSMGGYDTNSGEKRGNTKKRLQVFVDLSQNNESKHGDTSSVKDLPYIKTQKVPPGFSDNVTIFSKQEEMDWQSVQTHYLSKKTDSTRGLVE